ncbi:autotransporter outer membrane beta-barrel domain-containing protein [Nitratireductor sp. XY-223]|uniref:autotransporter outer membrane beta-barrel domain-containing protein n=1 Tax=Nitratireductor sp. XY-223 TaxID=2561926 RepID=UPI00145A268A|nr:autotransporter outer membrane beta-barrel domain-containing protein [Nitratireductor sp. XY-223]
MRGALFCSSALWLLPAPVAVADDITIPSGTTVTTTQTIDDVGDTATVEAGGAINVLDIPGILATASDQTVINDGTITSSGLSFSARGIFSLGTVGTPIENALIINNGTITTGRRAIELEFSVNGTVINNGVINALDSDGIVLDRVADNSVVINNGIISVFANDGIETNSPGALIINNGTITAFGDPDFSTGIEVLDSDSHVVNSGTIIATASTIDIIGDNVTLTLLAGSVLDGDVLFGAGSTLNIGSGLNLYLDYTERTFGNLAQVNSAIPIVHDEVNGIIYTVDPTGFALSQSFVQTTADAVHDAVREGVGAGNRFGGGFSGTGTFAYGDGAPGFDQTGPRGWVSGFGGYQSQDGSGAITGGNQAYGGVVAGGGFASEDRMYGVFAGGSFTRQETDHDTQTIDAASAYGGIYGGARSGAYWIDGSLMAGYSDFSSDRSVANNMVAGGLQTASADYDGYFISPSVTVGRSVGERTEISVGGQYAGLFLDGYTETGSAANLTVASRDVHAAAVRVKAAYLARQRQTDSGLVSLETWAGVDGVFNLGGDGVDVVLAGTPLNFAASFADASAIGFAGIGVNHRPTGGNWSLNASLEGRYGTDAYAEIRAAATATRRF